MCNLALIVGHILIACTFLLGENWFKSKGCGKITGNMTYNLKDIKSAKGISLVHLTARSLLKHFDEIDQDFLDGYFEAIIISESWLHQKVGDNLVNSELYNLHRLDRQTVTGTGNVKQGGGVCVYTR